MTYKAVASVALVLAVMGFAPATPSGSTVQHVQQGPPTTWLPPSRPDADKEPPFIVQATPGPAPTSFVMATCPTKPAPGPTKSTRSFVEAYMHATRNLQAKAWADALASADIAASFAVAPGEILAVANLRLAAQLGLDDKAGALATLEAMLRSGCLAPEQQGSAEARAAGLRNALGLP